MRRILFIGMLVFVILASSVYSANITVRMNVTNNGIIWDTHVRKDAPTTTQGTSDPNNLAINDYTSSEQGRAYVKYNLTPAITAGCNKTNINSAVMRIFSYQNDGFQELSASIYNVYDLSWQGETEDTITWNNQVCGTAFDSANCNLTSMDSETWSGNSEVFYDITPAVRRAFTEGNTSVSVVIKTSETAQTRYAYGRTKEYTAITGNVHYLNLSCDLGENVTYASITYYNLTSDACENWNTDKNNACKTSSVLPSIVFNTSEAAYCAIAASINSTAMNLNYSSMGISRNCTGAASGEGTKYHYCTLSTQDEFVYDSGYLFISCKTLGGNENRTSTSGPLALNITGLENTHRNAISTGIGNSLISGYDSYVEQKVYLRNSANNQAVATFDRLVKKQNKIWAFNRIGVADSYVNTFNITPVFYNFEFANKTIEHIINNTERFINSTR